MIGRNLPNGTSNVSTNARLELRIDEPIQPDSLEQVTLSDGGGEVPVIRQLSDDNRLVTLIPQGLLAQQTLFTVTVAGVTDLAGNTLSGGQTTFTTAQ